MKKVTFVLVAMVITTLFFACGKKDNTTGCTPSMDNMVGTWNIKSMIVTDISNGTSVEILASQPCLKDDQFIYKSGGTYSYTYGGTMCQANHAPSGTWLVSGNILKIDTEDWSIISFDCKTCVVSRTVGSYKYTNTVELQ